LAIGSNQTPKNSEPRDLLEYQALRKHTHGVGMGAELFLDGRGGEGGDDQFFEMKIRFKNCVDTLQQVKPCYHQLKVLLYAHTKRRRVIWLIIAQ